jgi:hypothetical protein
MGMFAFRRLREQEALASAGASFPIAEPTPKLEVTEELPLSTDGNNNRRNGGRRKRQLLPDAGSSGTDH